MLRSGEPAPPTFQPSPRARFVAALLRLLGPRRMRRALSAMKLRGLSVYSGDAAHAGHVMPRSPTSARAIAAWRAAPTCAPRCLA
ncbi:MAG: hypothetical protein U1E76_11455 [Planctomycetota bacterium]